jgi:hypothetical protein
LIDQCFLFVFVEGEVRHYELRYELVREMRPHAPEGLAAELDRALGLG